MENEEYNPEEPFYYKYKGVDFLTSDLEIEPIRYHHIYICCYDVNVEGKYPFLRFLLSKPYLNAELSFPQLYLLQNLTSRELINNAKAYLCDLMMVDNDNDNFKKSIHHSGYFETNDDLFLFFDITKCVLKLNDTYKTNHIWLALLDEIVNYKNVCNMPIDYSVVNFFTTNENFCFLLDERDRHYESPLVCYVNKPVNRLNFTFIFGQPKMDKNGLLGPFYYFKDFNTAFSNTTSPNTCNLETTNEIFTNTTVNYGIVRFAVFLGQMKLIENDINDNVDESEISAERLEDDSLDKNMERLTHRISDRDGKWAQEYDSAYVGCVELDNGTLIEEPVLVVKEYKQQIPLSYHFVDKKTLHKNSKEYSIM